MGKKESGLSRKAYQYTLYDLLVELSHLISQFDYERIPFKAPASIYRMHRRTGRASAQRSPSPADRHQFRHAKPNFENPCRPPRLFDMT